MAPQRFDKSLVLEQLLGLGGMGEVYLATQEGVGGFSKRVVVKRILPQIADDPHFQQMFIRETTISAKLDHANIARVFRSGQSEGYLYLVMEYIGGIDLRELLRKAKQLQVCLPLPFCCYAASQVAKGLDYAHSFRDPQTGEHLAIIHRDISPSNIVLGLGGEVKIIDFGIARAASTARLTQPGEIRGKLGYLAPEQLLGKEADQRSDIFSLGTVCYEMLTGQKLFPPEKIKNRDWLIGAADIEPVESLNPSVDHRLSRIVHHALCIDPDQRYRSAQEFHQAMHAHLALNYPSYTLQQFSELIRIIAGPIPSSTPAAKDAKPSKKTPLRAIFSARAPAFDDRATSPDNAGISRAKWTDFIVRLLKPFLASPLLLLLLASNILFACLLIQQRFRTHSAPVIPSAFPQPAALYAGESAAESWITGLGSPQVLPAIEGSQTGTPDSAQILPGLITSFDARTLQLDDKTPVAIWPGSGGFTAEQANPEAFPIFDLHAANNRPGIVFDGRRSFLVSDTVASALRQSQSSTFCYVTKVTEHQVHYVWSVHMAGGVVDVLRAGFNSQLQVQVKVDPIAHTDRLSLRVDDTDLAVYCLVAETTAFAVYRNGSELMKAPLPGLISYKDAAFFSIGQEWDGLTPTDFFAGILAELRIYDRALTDPERQLLERFLSAKWGIDLDGQ